MRSLWPVKQLRFRFGAHLIVKIRQIMKRIADMIFIYWFLITNHLLLLKFKNLIILTFLIF
jgi:hypothetical protein